MSENTFDFSENSEGMVLDFSDTRDADEPWPSGIYGPAAIVDAELKRSQAGNPYWNLRFNVLEGEATGQSFWYRITITPKTMSMAKRDLNRLGIDTSGQVTMNPELFLQRQALLRVTVDEWDGQLRNNVKELLPVDQDSEGAGGIF